MDNSKLLDMNTILFPKPIEMVVTNISNKDFIGGNFD